ncbi:MAG: PEP-CTERM sorting domain-containing protein [Ferrovum sp.]|jgi:hypothetical protein|uniref:PEP-CTERM sorting domain-containing protein n=1 Tax=Ferrovum sp. TaxID=2609467 RepID=UPI002618E4BE|nr:PEP-CTERM sorting domain-containing protein [Ferrovum sp.]MBW8066036.1 PEP-CTERM sorting domain-containing protein [Ferrovum sp.]
MIKTKRNTRKTLAERRAETKETKTKRTLSRFLTVAAGVSLSVWSVTGEASTITDNLYYTMGNQGATTGNIFEMAATVSAQTGAITYSNSSMSIAATGYGTTANGIVMNPANGQLLVGGGQSGGGFFPSPVYQVNPSTGNIATATDPGYMNNVDMAVGPSNKVWTAGGGGSVASFPINPFGGSGTVLPLSGSDTAISSLAFDPKNNTMYYTSGGFFGTSTGNFGTLNLATGKTTALLTNQPGMFNLAYDPFSGDLIAAGSSLITQITPAGAIVSGINVNAVMGSNGWVISSIDTVGKGQLFATTGGGTNGDNLLYFNYAKQGLVGQYNYSAGARYMGFGLSGITGLTLPTTGGGSSAVPEPSTGLLFLTGLAGVCWFGFTRHRSASYA